MLLYSKLLKLGFGVFLVVKGAWGGGDCGSIKRPTLLYVNVLFFVFLHPPPNAPHKWFLVGCSSPFMRLAEHLAALHAWCKRDVPGW